MDLATANQDSATLSALPGLGAGVFGTAVVAAVGTTPEIVAARDLDGLLDGRPHESLELFVGVLRTQRGREQESDERENGSVGADCPSEAKETGLGHARSVYGTRATVRP